MTGQRKVGERRVRQVGVEEDGVTGAESRICWVTSLSAGGSVRVCHRGGLVIGMLH